MLCITELWSYTIKQTSFLWSGFFFFLIIMTQSDIGWRLIDITLIPSVNLFPQAPSALQELVGESSVS